MIKISTLLRTAAYQIKLAGLLDHAREEIRRAGLCDKDADYNGMIGKSVLELCDVFSKQGHSGFSGPWVLDVFTRLARFKNLTPLTSNPDEWSDVSEASGSPLWQNKRDTSTFSKDGGKTWYQV